MEIWLIEPHDPLIVRDGRPFGPNPGARATSLSFPFPSTTTGGARTRAGLNDKEGLIRQLIPRKIQQFANDAETDLDAKNKEALMLVGLPEHEDDLGKPHKKPPLYWYWNIFVNWLLDPSRYDGGEVVLSRLGHKGPEREHRLHVSIDAGRRAAKEGALFETSGLEFTYAGKGQQRLSEAQRLA